MQQRIDLHTELDEIDVMPSSVRNIASPVSAISSRVSFKSNQSAALRLTQQNLQQLKSNIGSLHETDIFKICIKTMQPS